MSVRLSLYDFEVDGGLPGIDGCIRVAAGTMPDAQKMARKELDKLNLYRTECGTPSAVNGQRTACPCVQRNRSRMEPLGRRVT